MSDLVGNPEDQFSHNDGKFKQAYKLLQSKHPSEMAVDIKDIA